MKSTSKKKVFGAFALVLIATILGSFGPPVFRRVVDHMNVEVGVMYFLFLGGFLMFIIRPPAEIKSKELIKRMFEFGIFTRIFFVGFLTASTFVFYTMAMQTGSVTEAVILVRLDPLFIVLFSSLFLGEKIKSWVTIFFAVVLCLLGIAIFQGVDYSNLKKINSVFIFFGILTAFSNGLRISIQGYLQKSDKISKEFNSSIGMIIGALILLFYLIIKRQLLIIPTGVEIALLLFLGFGTIAIPMYLTLKAYKTIGSMGKISFFEYLLPLFTAVIAYFLNNEKGFNYFNLFLGFAIITIGVFIANKSIARNNATIE